MSTRGMGTRMAAMAVAATLSVGTFAMAGCAQQPQGQQQTQQQQQEKAEEKLDTKQVVEEIKKANQEFNGHMSGTMTMTMSAKAQSSSNSGSTADPNASATAQSIDINASLDFNVAGDKAHGTMSVPLAGLESDPTTDANATRTTGADANTSSNASGTGASGSDRTMTAEMYVENDPANSQATTYTTYDGSSWTKVSGPTGQSMSDVPSSMTKSLDDEGVTVKRTSDGYRLELDEAATKQLTESIPNATGTKADLSQMSLAAGAKASVDVDDKFKLKSMYLDVSIGGDEKNNENMLSGLTVGMTFDLTFSDSGRVSETEVTVPDDVKSNAVESQSGLGANVGIGSTDTTGTNSTTATPGSTTTDAVTSGSATGTTSGEKSDATSATATDATTGTKSGSATGTTSDASSNSNSQKTGADAQTTTTAK